MQKPVWKKIAEEISLEVSLGRWTVGSIIPNEIDLAKRYKVSRDTMRKALTYLTQQGLFERKPAPARCCRAGAGFLPGENQTAFYIHQAGIKSLSFTTFLPA